MPCTLPYWKGLLIAADQFLNAATGGWPDETLSSRAHRLRLKGKPCLAKAIDTLFFLDKEGEKRHCELSFETEREGRQLPPEARSIETRDQP